MKSSPYLAAFNGGELSPRMDGRTDFDRYPLAVSNARNLLALPQGGVTMRPGTRFIKEIKSSSSAAAIYGFEPTAGNAYVLEFGSTYIRFFRNQDRLAAPTVSSAITNGTFPANITGWDDRSTGTASISWDATGKLKMNGSPTGYAWAEQSVSVSGGDQSSLHIFRFTLSGNPGLTATVQIGTASKGRQLWNKSGYGIGQHTVAVTPGASPIYFQVIYKGADTQALYLDDVSILSNTSLELNTSPYGTSDVGNLRFAQSNDVLYIFHSSYKPYKLERRGDYSWSLVTVFFEDGPWGEINPEIDLGDYNLVTNPSFDGGIQGWTTATADGSVEYDGSQGVVFFHDHPNANNQHAYLKQTVTTGDSATPHVMHFQAVGRGKLVVTVGSTDGGGEILAETAYDPGWYSVPFTPGVSTIYIQFGAKAGITSADNDVPGVGGVFIYNTHANLLTASATTGSVTITAYDDFEPFASTDVGRLIRLEHAGREAGWAVITAYTSTQAVTAYVYRKFASTTYTETWRFGSWSDTTGWPRFGCFYQQRLFAANTTSQTQSFWASQSGDFQNMRPDSWVEGAVTVEDDDAMNYTLGAKRGSPIQWFAGTRKLIIGTATGQWIVSSKGVALTPTDLVAEPHTSVRGATLEPIEIDTVALFIENNKQSVDDIGFNYDIDGFQAADLNILADHIAGSSTFEQIVYQSKPFAHIWARKADGTIGVLTYKRQQNVVGWSPVTIAASSAGAAVVESLAVIPGQTASGTQTYDSNNRDEIWLIVKRTINSSTKRYIECVEGFYKGPNRVDYDTRAAWLSAQLTAQKDAVYVDAAITYSGVSTATITGLSHLEGETVYANAAGLVQGPFTVSSGQITLTTAATKAQVGLNYSWRVRGLKMNYGAQSGSSVGQQKQIGTFAFVLLDSASFQYGVEATGEKGRDTSFFTASSHIPSTGQLYTGEAIFDKPDADWDSDPRFILKGSNPLPFTLLGIMPKVMTNER